MFRFQKVSLLGILFLLCVVSASCADDLLTFQKGITLDEETQKELGGKNYPLADVLFPEDSTIIALSESLGSGKLVRIDLKTDKVQIGYELKLGWSDKPLFQYGEYIWVSSTLDGFRHADLRPGAIPKKKGKLTANGDGFYLSHTGKYMWPEVAREDGKIKFNFKKFEPETGAFATKTVSANNKGSTHELRKRACEFGSMTFLYAEIPEKDIPDEYTHWLVRPEKNQAVSIKLPAPASRVVAVDDTHFLIGTDAGSIHLLDATQPDKMTLIDAKFDFTVNDLEITKDKRFAFCSSLDRKKDNLIVLDIETKKVIYRHQLKQPSFHRLSLSPNEKVLAVIDGTDTISLFEVKLPAKK